MAKYDPVMERYYIEPDDQLVANDVDLTVDKDGAFKLSGLEDATIFYWDEKEEQSYEISYATDISKDDPDYGQAYFEKL